MAQIFLTGQITTIGNNSDSIGIDANSRANITNSGIIIAGNVGIDVFIRFNDQWIFSFDAQTRFSAVSGNLLTRVFDSLDLHAGAGMQFRF